MSLTQQRLAILAYRYRQICRIANKGFMPTKHVKHDTLYVSMEDYLERCKHIEQANKQIERESRFFDRISNLLNNYIAKELDVLPVDIWFRTETNRLYADGQKRPYVLWIGKTSERALKSSYNIFVTQTDSKTVEKFNPSDCITIQK